ncbi:MAG TPA: hypothetical protein VHI13_20240 [Candidatus Kapabacteria bacterium]|nr:hypothetical protein [Candidatus Kapabacteria bacterium]
MSETNERLYNLLPAIYRARDLTVGGETLRALLGVLETEFNSVVDDIDTLYDDWFIETCQEWVVPYIGDLLGVRPLNEIVNGEFTRRAYVANTFAYRQRKGTPAVIEQLARDVTGWPARIVEYFKLLAVTQNYNHSRPANQLLDLRHQSDLELLGSPFEKATYSPEVRRIALQRGKYNIPSVGIYLWRLQAYPLVRVDAAPVLASERSDHAGLFRFSPLGNDTPLFNRPQTEASITTFAGEVNVPGRLRRRPLYDELEERRRLMLLGQSGEPVYFGPQPVLELFTHATGAPANTYVAVPPENISICDLSDWRRPTDASGLISVDPVLGRISFAAHATTDAVRVSYQYGFSADVGGGVYNRSETLAPADDINNLNIFVSKEYPATVTDTTLEDTSHELRVNSIAAAVAYWAGKPQLHCVVEIRDSATYTQPISVTFTPPADPDLGLSLRIQARDGERPALILGSGAIKITSHHPRSTLTLNGLLISCNEISVAGDLGELDIVHCTVVPGRSLGPDGTPAAPSDGNSLNVDATNNRLVVNITSSIVGRLLVPLEMRSLTITDSIVDGLDGPAIYGGESVVLEFDAMPHSIGGGTGGSLAHGMGDLLAGAPTSIIRSTVFGPVFVAELAYASESIFTDIVEARRRQSGCVRFCYLPVESKTPRRYHCQPETAASSDITVVSDNAARRVVPEFTSTHYGDPGYAQLTITTAIEIRTGAEDGSEMGVYCQLKGPQREANLRIGLDEYMRLGLDTGIFFVT